MTNYRLLDKKLKEVEEELGKSIDAVYKCQEVRVATDKDHKEYSDLCLLNYQIRVTRRMVEMISAINDVPK